MASRKSVAVLPAETPVPRTNPEPILTPEEVAVRLRLKPSTIYEMTRRRNRRPIPSRRAGKFLRFYWSEVEQWLRGAES